MGFGQTVSTLCALCSNDFMKEIVNLIKKQYFQCLETFIFLTFAVLRDRSVLRFFSDISFSYVLNKRGFYGFEMASFRTRFLDVV